MPVPPAATQSLRPAPHRVPATPARDVRLPSAPAPDAPAPNDPAPHDPVPHAPAPGAPDRGAPDPAVLAARFGHLPAQEMVTALAGAFRGRIALVSSFGADSAVLLNLVARADPAMPVLFLDTGRLFDETLAYRDALARSLGLRDLRSVAPDPRELEADPRGTLWRDDPDRCCAIRKVRPLERALAGFDLWISGRKRHQSATRAALPLFEADGTPDRPRVKANPLADWDAAAIETHRLVWELPAHPLVARGYPSIGCAPCTSRVAPGEDPRAGRWRGSAKTECGIHRAAPA